MTRGETTEPSPPLPVVVTIGFSGARRLYAAGDDVEARERALQRAVVDALRELPGQLELTPQHRLVGLSALAAGADLLFTHAAAELGWRQRLLLPQARADFLAAQGSRGADFDSDERAAALALFESPHIIEETVASGALDRGQRFEDTALQIVVEADVLVCLRRADTTPGPGGTSYLAGRALARGKPVLDLVIGVDESGAPTWQAQWQQLERFSPPTLPRFLSNTDRHDAATAASRGDDFLDRLKATSSARSAAHSGWFKRAAWVIVSTHVGATLVALLALKAHGTRWEALAPWALAFELVLLATGLICHEWLHRASATPGWAMARLSAEIARSAIALRGMTFPLRRIDAMPFPRELQGLLRTIHALSLQRAPEPSNEAWVALRKRYLEVRLRAAGTGQIDYYRQQRLRAMRWNRRATRWFSVFSAVAFIAALSEAVLPTHAHWAEHVVGTAGVLAIWLPVLAVGVLSLAAAHDLDARAHTFADMHGFLVAQAGHIESATSYREFAVLAQETEVRLLGETLIWFARRSYTGVA